MTSEGPDREDSLDSDGETWYEDEIVASGTNRNAVLTE